MRLAGILSALSSLLLLASCAPTEAGDKCLQDTNCGVGFICDHKVECAASTDCTQGFACGPDGVCALDENEDGTIIADEDNTNTPEGVCAVPCNADNEATVCVAPSTCKIIAPATQGACRVE
jgi:hypothetical protein